MWRRRVLTGTRNLLFTSLRLPTPLTFIASREGRGATSTHTPPIALYFSSAVFDLQRRNRNFSQGKQEDEARGTFVEIRSEKTRDEEEWRTRQFFQGRNIVSELVADVYSPGRCVSVTPNYTNLETARNKQVFSETNLCYCTLSSRRPDQLNLKNTETVLLMTFECF